MQKSFLLHTDSLDVLDQLTDEQAGKLFKAIRNYNKNGAIGEADQLTKIALTPFINQFTRDKEKYNATVERNKLNGSKGGRPKKPTGLSNKPKKPSGLSGLSNKPKKPDSKNDNDNDSDSKNDKEIKIPDFIEADLWNGYLKGRKKPTEQAVKLLIKKMTDWNVEGLDPNKALRHSIENGYTGLFMPNEAKQATNSRIKF